MCLIQLNASKAVINIQAHRVVGNIWCVGAGELSSCPVRDTNSGNPGKLTSPSVAS